MAYILYSQAGTKLARSETKARIKICKKKFEEEIGSKCKIKRDQSWMIQWNLTDTWENFNETVYGSKTEALSEAKKLGLEDEDTVKAVRIDKKGVEEEQKIALEKLLKEFRTGAVIIFEHNKIQLKGLIIRASSVKYTILTINANIALRSFRTSEILTGNVKLQGIGYFENIIDQYTKNNNFKSLI